MSVCLFSAHMQTGSEQLLWVAVCLSKAPAAGIDLLCFTSNLGRAPLGLNLLFKC